MKIEQKKFSKTNGWEIIGDRFFDTVPVDIVLVYGSKHLLADPSVFKAIRRDYPTGLIIINTKDEEIDDVHCVDDIVTASAISFNCSSMRTAVVNVTPAEPDRKAGRLLAEICCRRNLKSILMLYKEKKIVGVETIEDCRQNLTPAIIADETNIELIHSLSRLNEHVVVGAIKRIEFYEEALEVNFEPAVINNIFELDRRLEKSKKKLVYQLQEPAGSLSIFYRGHGSSIVMQETDFPLCMNVHNVTFTGEKEKMIENRICKTAINSTLGHH